jgi:phospholipid/cholesterol/gamma-HCH transport system substrate-binding protein
VASIKQSLDKLQNSLTNLEEITAKVRDGEGVAGKLLTDERLGQKVSESVEDLSSFADRVTRLQTEVSVRSEYLMSQGTSKNALAIRLIPRPDKYYLLEIVDDPRGVVEQQVVQNNPPQVGQPAEQLQTVRKEGLKFSAQFAKRFYWTTLRFGLIESSGGIGADFHFFNNHVTLSTDAFNFSVQEVSFPRVRSSLKFSVFNHLFASAGVDDLLNPQVRETGSNKLIAGRDYFMGGGIYFTDEDLKAILTTTGVPKP